MGCTVCAADESNLRRVAFQNGVANRDGGGEWQTVGTPQKNPEELREEKATKIAGRFDTWYNGNPSDHAGDTISNDLTRAEATLVKSKITTAHSTVVVRVGHG